MFEGGAWGARVGDEVGVCVGEGLEKKERFYERERETLGDSLYCVG